MRRDTPRPRGFTLVEVAVALTILGLLAATLYLAFEGSLRNAQRIREAQEPYQRGRVARSFITSALRSATPFSGLANDKFFAVDSTVAGIPRDELSFITVAPRGTGRMQVHLYVADTGTGPELQIGVRPFIAEGDSLPDFETTTLSPGVGGLQVEYLAGPASRSAVWLDRWESPIRLPHAVRLSFLPPQAETGKLGTRDADPLYRTPLVVQIPAGRTF